MEGRPLRMKEADLGRILTDLASRTPGFPQVTGMAMAAGECRVELEVDSGLCWFEGHFPEFPVLPGVVQLHWAVLFARAAFGLSGSPREIKRLKFKKPMIPPRSLVLFLSIYDGHQVQFAFHSSDESNSEGRLVFPDPG